MNPETLFTAANLTAAVFWLLLIIAPGWRLTETLLAPVIVALLLAVAYAVLLIPQLNSEGGGLGSLAQVRLAFDNDHILLAAWIHYLVFDLFIGCWEMRDARRVGMPHLAVIPCLILTFMLGPIGLLLYLSLRILWKRQFRLTVS